MLRTQPRKGAFELRKQAPMNDPVTPNDLDRAVLAMKRSNAAMPDLCRRLCEGDLWVLLPYHPEFAGQDFELKNGMALPFAQFQGKHGLEVPAFSSEFVA